MSQSKPVLKLDWCSHEAAKYAVEHWHYSRCMPLPPLVKIGAWEDGKFIGCVLFSRGANLNIGTPYNLAVTEVCELTRVALTRHVSPVSRVVAIAIKFLKNSSPNLKLVISYADPLQNHHGGIYQAGNWVYVGTGKESVRWYYQGKWRHNREITYGAFGSGSKTNTYKNLPSRIVEGKHKYLYPLTSEMREKIEPLRKPYPKRATGENSDTPAIHAGEEGAEPIVALQEVLNG